MGHRGYLLGICNKHQKYCAVTSDVRYAAAVWRSRFFLDGVVEVLCDYTTLLYIILVDPQDRAIHFPILNFPLTRTPAYLCQTPRPTQLHTLSLRVSKFIHLSRLA